MSGDRIRITCPPSNISKELRIRQLFENIEVWCRSEALSDLFSEFNITIDQNLDLKSYIEYISTHASRLWDFRKQTSSGQRWDVSDSGEIESKADFIFASARKLGLADITEPVFRPDYILPLGGARLTNLLRPQMARYVIDENDWSDLTVVALSAYRPKMEIDEPYYSEYAPDALTEYDAICRGIEKAFDLKRDYEEKISGGDILYARSTIRHYTSGYKGCDIYAMAAPSPEPEKRWANSRDNYEFFLKHFNIKPGDKILLTTSCIYVPTQHLRFMDIAIEKGFEVDCIGVTPEIQGSSFNKPSNYLQEIKSTIDAIYDLSCRYL